MSFSKIGDEKVNLSLLCSLEKMIDLTAGEYCEIDKSQENVPK